MSYNGILKGQIKVNFLETALDNLYTYSYEDRFITVFNNLLESNFSNYDCYERLDKYTDAQLNIYESFESSQVLGLTYELRILKEKLKSERSISIALRIKAILAELKSLTSREFRQLKKILLSSIRKFFFSRTINFRIYFKTFLRACFRNLDDEFESIANISGYPALFGFTFKQTIYELQGNGNYRVRKSFKL